MINVGRDYFANKLIFSTLQNFDHIQMGLDFGFNSYAGISDACPRAEFVAHSSSQYFYSCCLNYQPEKDQIFGIAISSGLILDEKIFLETRNGENVIFKLNCRENLTMSIAPLYLHIKEQKEEDVGDFAIIKFIKSSIGTSPASYTAVCEGLVLGKFLIDFIHNEIFTSNFAV